jgi:hypothetical protein
VGIRVRPSQEGEGYGRKGRRESESRGRRYHHPLRSGGAVPRRYRDRVSEYFHPAREDWEERKIREMMDEEGGS